MMDEFSRDMRSGSRPLIGATAAPSLHVMSWNIRRRLPVPSWRKADRWSRRAAPVESLLRAEQPAVLGVQEALADQANVVLRALGDRYRRIGVGRSADGSGEGCPIFFDTGRLELLSWEQRALSDRPSKPGSVSVSWGNMFPRIMVTASFRDRETAASLFVVNTHFDHLSPCARVKSARAVRQQVFGQPYPAVVMGDLNAGEKSACLRELRADGRLVDTWAAAQRQVTARWGTHANYREPRRGGRRIDWIVATPGVDVVDAAINPARYDGAWGSDHLPVQAVIDVTSQKAAP